MAVTMKKTSIAIYSTCGLSHTLSSSLPFLPHQSATCAPCKRLGPRQRWEAPGRAYATVSDNGSSRNRSSHHIRSSHRWPTSARPTPYDIFDIKRGTPYSKAKFYELVKIYHPDRHRHTGDIILTSKTRLERYRLVVAANEILSDPVKRRAYDLYGAGWGGVAGHEGSAYREADTSWRSEPGNPSQNATWEDWEEWYESRRGDSKKKQTPLYMSNEMFVAVLCAFVIIGSMGQARRASSSSVNLVEAREERHEAISQNMWQRQRELALLDRNERVEVFLRQRDDWKLSGSPPSNIENKDPERPGKSND